STGRPYRSEGYFGGDREGNAPGSPQGGAQNEFIGHGGGGFRLPRCVGFQNQDEEKGRSAFPRAGRESGYTGRGFTSTKTFPSGGRFRGRDRPPGKERRGQMEKEALRSPGGQPGGGKGFGLRERFQRTPGLQPEKGEAPGAQKGFKKPVGGKTVGSGRGILKGFLMFLKRLFLSAFIIGAFSGNLFGEVRSLKGKQIFVPGEILVRLKEGASFDDRSRALALLGTAKVLHQPDFFKIKLKGNLEVRKAADQMQKDPAVLSAQPNYCYYALACPAPTDSYYVTAGANWPFS